MELLHNLVVYSAQFTERLSVARISVRLSHGLIETANSIAYYIPYGSNENPARAEISLAHLSNRCLHSSRQLPPTNHVSRIIGILRFLCADSDSMPHGKNFAERIDAAELSNRSQPIAS